MVFNKNIVLIGLMGAGKSTVGLCLQELLQGRYTFVDTDSMIEKEMEQTIPQIFAQEGESFFRDVESKVIHEISQKTHQIIATGGGAVLREKNFYDLKQNGVIFYLKADIKTLAQRVQNDNNRPLLSDCCKEDKLMQLLEEREVFYSKADFIINTNKKIPKDIAREILSCIK